MAQLGGRTIRTLVTSLEALSDDGKLVLMFDREESGNVRIRTRLPWESAWANNGSSFQLGARNARLLGKLFESSDVSYSRSELDEIETSDFTADAPPDSDAAAQAQADYEARCTELDIERARAANIQQEFILDHSRDKHITADVPGCPSCEAKVIPSVMPERPSDEDGESDPDDLPL